MARKEEFEIDAEMLVSLIKKLFEKKQISAEERHSESKPYSSR